MPGRCPFWVTPKLGGCRIPRPGDLQRLRAERVTLLVSLVEDEELYDHWPGGPREFIEALEAAGIKVLRLSTPDFHAPDPWEACRAYETVKRETERCGRVVVHCYGGIGRTGTFIAGYLVAVEGLSLEEALEAVGRHGAGPQSEDQWYYLQFIRLHCSSQ